MGWSIYELNRPYHQQNVKENVVYFHVVVYGPANNISNVGQNRKLIKVF